MHFLFAIKELFNCFRPASRVELEEMRRQRKALRAYKHNARRSARHLQNAHNETMRLAVAFSTELRALSQQHQSLIEQCKAAGLTVEVNYKPGAYLLKLIETSGGEGALASGVECNTTNGDENGTQDERAMG